jgi:hypothetical protein
LALIPDKLPEPEVAAMLKDNNESLITEMSPLTYFAPAVKEILGFGSLLSPPHEPKKATTGRARAKSRCLIFIFFCLLRKFQEKSQFSKQFLMYFQFPTNCHRFYSFDLFSDNADIWHKH